MIEYRHRIAGNEEEKARLLELVDEHWGPEGSYAQNPEAFRNMNRGLFLLVELVLGVEADYWDNDRKVIREFQQVILEELRKSDLPEEVLVGK